MQKYQTSGTAEVERSASITVVVIEYYHTT